MRRAIGGALVVIGMIALGACSDDSNTDQGRSLTPAAVTISVPHSGTLAFNWPAVPGATHYQLLKSSDGVDAYLQVGSDLLTNSAIDLVSALNHDWVNARYMVSACNAQGCAASAPLSSMPAMIEAIGSVATTPIGGDLRNVVIAADGNMLAVQQGETVYVWVRPTDAWELQAELRAANTENGDLFGGSMAFSADGNTLAIGAFAEDGSATTINGDGTDNSAIDSGAAYIFVRNGDAWSQQAYIKAPNAETTDTFFEVALSGDGNTLAVSTIYEDSDADGIDGNQADNSADGAGAVYVYARSGTNWVFQSYIKAAASTTSDFFGMTVALSYDGNTLAVGGTNENSSSTGINTTPTMTIDENGSGAAWIFARNGGTWSQQAYIKPPYGPPAFGFGIALTLSADGDTLAASAADWDGDQSGRTFVYHRSSTNWSLQADLQAATTEAHDYFGRELSLSADGNFLVVGALGEDGDSKGINGDPTSNLSWDSGAVYLFVRDGATWTESRYIKSPNTVAYDGFGGVLALSADGSKLAVGVPGANGSEVVYLY